MRFSGKIPSPREDTARFPGKPLRCRIDPGVHTKCSRRHPISRVLGFLRFIVLMLCTLSAPVLAQQAEPTGQMPEAIRGAKIYQLPTKGGQPAPNPGVYKSLSFRDINFDRLLLGLSVSIRARRSRRHC